MKYILIILGILLLAFIGVQLFAIRAQRSIETYPYVIKEKYETFEVRVYKASLFSSVKLSSGEYKKASGQGFSILAGYIFGSNEKNEKIAMTSPVAMSLEDSMTVMFMVHRKYEQKTLPSPSNSAITFHKEPAKTVAVIRFGGWASDKRINKYKKQLTKALENESIGYTDRFHLFGYNAPYEIFGRKNEVVVELQRG
ncbi:MAG: heme-binding protein [Saprospiraceae bacterium]|nr:heme-binding protein [Saprospiraceae bacterium]